MWQAVGSAGGHWGWRSGEVPPVWGIVERRSHNSSGIPQQATPAEPGTSQRPVPHHGFNAMLPELLHMHGVRHSMRRLGYAVAKPQCIPLSYSAETRRCRQPECTSHSCAAHPSRLLTSYVDSTQPRTPHLLEA